MKTKLLVLSMRLSGAFALLLTAAMAAMDRASAEFDPGKYFGCADTSLFNGVAKQSNQLTGWAIGLGVIFLGALIIFGAYKIGTAKDDVGKATAGATQIKHAGYGLGIIIIALPLLFVVLKSLNVFC